MQGGNGNGGRSSLQGNKGRNSLQGGRHSIQGTGQRVSLQGGTNTIAEEEETGNENLTGRSSMQGNKNNAGQRSSLQGGSSSSSGSSSVGQQFLAQKKRSSGNMGGLSKSKVAPVTTKKMNANPSTESLNSNSAQDNDVTNFLESDPPSPSPADLGSGSVTTKRMETLQPIKMEKRLSGDVSADLEDLTKATQQRQASKAVLRGPSANMLAHRAKGLGGHRRTLL